MTGGVQDAGQNEQNGSDEIHRLSPWTCTRLPELYVHRTKTSRSRHVGQIRGTSTSREHRSPRLTTGCGVLHGHGNPRQFQLVEAVLQHYQLLVYVALKFDTSGKSGVIIAERS